MMIISVISIGISLVAIVMSWKTSILQNESEKRMNDINLEAELWVDVFKKYIISLIPNARKKIFIDPSGFLKDWNELSVVLSKLKNDAIYFQYRNKKFYSDLMAKKIEIEEFLGCYDGKQIQNKEVTEFFSKLDELIDEFYNIIFSNYLNGNTK